MSTPSGMTIRAIKQDDDAYHWAEVEMNKGACADLFAYMTPLCMKSHRNMRKNLNTAIGKFFLSMPRRKNIIVLFIISLCRVPTGWNP